MMFAHRVDSVRFRGRKMILVVDGCQYSFDLSVVSPRLASAGKKERESYEISNSGYGIHWPLLDEDLSIGALIDSANRNSALTRRH